jgi:hypothetical protein
MLSIKEIERAEITVARIAMVVCRHNEKSREENVLMRISDRGDVAVCLLCTYLERSLDAAHTAISNNTPLHNHNLPPSFAHPINCIALYSFFDKT